MAGRKLPVLPSNSTPADDDLMYNVDVSDTSESAAGTSKQNTFLQAYTYVAGKLATALRLIPSGGTTGQVLAKSSDTDYDVEWTAAGGGSSAVNADAPILGDGTSGDHLRLDFDATPTDASSKLVNSNAVYDFSMTVVNITNAALNTLCSGGTVNAKAMYRVTDAAQGVVRVWGKSSTQVSCAAFLEGSADGSTYLEGEWGNYDLSVDLFASILPKEYIALMTQSGTDAPVATVLKNTLGGNIIWTRDSAGFYIGTLAGAFLENKYFAPVPDTGLDAGANQGGGGGAYNYFRLSDNEISLTTSLAADDALNYSPIKIQVYS